MKHFSKLSLAIYLAMTPLCVAEKEMEVEEANSRIIVLDLEEERRLATQREQGVTNFDFLKKYHNLFLFFLFFLQIVEYLPLLITSATFPPTSVLLEQF